MQAADTSEQPLLPSSCSMGRPQNVRASLCLESGMPLAAELLDLARLDLLILTDRPLRFGTSLQVAIFCDLVNGVSYNRAVVHFCRATHRGWEVGAFLSQPVPEFLSCRLIDDLRRQLRYECDWKAWVLWEHSGELDPVRVVSYSIDGLRMKTQRPVESGSLLSLFCSAGHRDQATLNAQVRWCRTSDDSWTVGCSVIGQRGRELPRMFGNLTAVHIEPTDSQFQLNSGESCEMLLTRMAEPERFLPAQH